MKHKVLQYITMAGCLTLLLALGAPLSGWASAAETGPDNVTCVECHDGYDKLLAQTPHRLAATSSGAAVTVACISCHAGGNEHAENPSKANITNPANLTGQKAQDACAACHLPHQEMDNYGYNAHTLQQVNCADCHRIHAKAPTVGLLIDDNTDFCGKCHQGVKTKFSRRSNHPVLQGAMTCLSCHRFSKRADMNQAYDFARVCQNCHADVTGPYQYEHDVVNGYSVQGSGCVECHDRHGSENDKLLRQPINLLCKQCHAGHPVVPVDATSNHKAEFATMNCLTCHVDIHGSMVNRRLLDSDLPAKLGVTTCYCHDAN